MKGDKFCNICHCWIGNYNTGETPEGEKSYYSIIRSKYCTKCRPLVISSQTNLRLHNMRQRNKQIRKAERTRLELLEEENRLLRERIIKLREDNNRGGL